MSLVMPFGSHRVRVIEDMTILDDMSIRPTFTGEHSTGCFVAEDPDLFFTGNGKHEQSICIESGKSVDSNKGRSIKKLEKCVMLILMKKA
mmetsp:Transcript_12883/g.21052  ORF Transcript_12883/g.21052 Transcript_12883/m.21052 type:complete len:90 (-) Transcript_12883:172-441(-)